MGLDSCYFYSILYLTGYKSVSLHDIKNFRQLDSICAGHPEYHPNTGIELQQVLWDKEFLMQYFAISEEILRKNLKKQN